VLSVARGAVPSEEWDMVIKVKAVKKRTAKATKGSAVAKKVFKKGHTVWKVTSGGKVRHVAARRASVKAIDEGVKLYGSALKSLANR